MVIVDSSGLSGLAVTFSYLKTEHRLSLNKYDLITMKRIIESKLANGP